MTTLMPELACFLIAALGLVTYVAATPDSKVCRMALWTFGAGLLAFLLRVRN